MSLLHLRWRIVDSCRYWLDYFRPKIQTGSASHNGRTIFWCWRLYWLGPRYHRLFFGLNWYSPREDKWPSIVITLCGFGWTCRPQPIFWDGPKS